MSVESDLTELIRTAQKGDESAFAVLLNRLRPALKFIAELEVGEKLQRREDPADIVQRTEIEAFQAIEKFRGSTEAEFTAWIKTILRRKIANAIRDNRADKRDVRLEKYFDAEEGSINIPWMTPGRRRHATASKLAIKAEAALKLLAALEELPEDQRTAVRLRHLQGLSVEDICSKMDKTPASVAGLLRRGLQALRDQMEGDTSWI